MQDWQLRVVQEKEDLDKKVKALSEFLEKQKEDWFYTPMGAAMGEQYLGMLKYQSALRKRIVLFGGGNV